MSEYFEGVEGAWLRGNPLGESWNEGHWRKVENTRTHYKDGLIFDVADGESYTYTTPGSRQVDKYWERFVPVVKVPTEPGLYRDKDGDLWTITADGEYFLYSDEDSYWNGSSAGDAEQYLPFVFLASLNGDN